MKKLKNAVVILDKFNNGHCGIKVKVILALAKFNHLLSKSPADGSKLRMVLTQAHKQKTPIISYTIIFTK